MDWENYKSHIKSALDNFSFDPEILRILKNSPKNDQMIFIAGNGGSAAIASHYVCDLSKGANKNWKASFKRFRAMSLVDNISYITAISNDEHYEDVFKQQLINHAKPNDILILISSSGNSPNIINAAKWSKENGLIVIGITGFTGGKLKDICDYGAHITHDRYEVCEDIHHIFGQFLATHLRETDDDTATERTRL